MASFERAFRTVPGSVLLLAALSGACSPRTGTPGDMGDTPGTQLTVQDQLLLASAKVALPPAGIAPADLPDANTSAAQTWSRYCVMCHSLPTPLAHSATDWPRTLRRMWLRMGMIEPSFGVPVPTAAERFAMLAYADSNALQVASGQLPDLPGRELFVQTCSRCHELADPYQHSPEDWTAVVRRMMGHMEEILGTSLAPDQMAQLSEYLQSVSRRTA